MNSSIVHVRADTFFPAPDDGGSSAPFAFADALVPIAITDAQGFTTRTLRVAHRDGTGAGAANVRHRNRGRRMWTALLEAYLERRYLWVDGDPDAAIVAAVTQWTAAGRLQGMSGQLIPASFRTPATRAKISGTPRQLLDEAFSSARQFVSTLTSYLQQRTQTNATVLEPILGLNPFAEAWDGSLTHKHANELDRAEDVDDDWLAGSIRRWFVTLPYGYVELDIDRAKDFAFRLNDVVGVSHVKDVCGSADISQFMTLVAADLFAGAGADFIAEYNRRKLEYSPLFGDSRISSSWPDVRYDVAVLVMDPELSGVMPGTMDRLVSRIEKLEDGDVQTRFLGHALAYWNSTVSRLGTVGLFRHTVDVRHPESSRTAVAEIVVSVGQDGELVETRSISGGTWSVHQGTDLITQKFVNGYSADSTEFVEGKSVDMTFDPDGNSGRGRMRETITVSPGSWAVESFTSYRVVGNNYYLSSRDFPALFDLTFNQGRTVDVVIETYTWLDLDVGNLDTQSWSHNTHVQSGILDGARATVEYSADAIVPEMIADYPGYSSVTLAYPQYPSQFAIDHGYAPLDTLTGYVPLYASRKNDAGTVIGHAGELAVQTVGDGPTQVYDAIMQLFTTDGFADSIAQRMTSLIEEVERQHDANAPKNKVEIGTAIDTAIATFTNAHPAADIAAALQRQTFAFVENEFAIVSVNGDLIDGGYFSLDDLGDDMYMLKPETSEAGRHYYATRSVDGAGFLPTPETYAGYWWEIDPARPFFAFDWIWQALGMNTLSI